LGTRGLWGKSNMYEESAGVPMIMAGPEIPESVVCREPVSLVDCFPTILSCVGVPKHRNDSNLPGASLFDIVRGAAPRRTVMSEYHAAGAATGTFMIRKGSYKYVYYVGMPTQLFDLDDDPQETRDLGQNPDYRSVIKDCDVALRRVVDPEATDRQAFADQERRIAELGGRDVILARGSFGYSPVPGTKAVYVEIEQSIKA
jgi:choline-sulfatase